MKAHAQKLFATIAVVILMNLLGCATAPRITTDQVPVFPGAVRLANDEHILPTYTIADIEKKHEDIRRNFNTQGAHTEIAFRVPAESATPQDISGWYYKTLTANGWRSRYAVAYTVYENGAGQNLTVYVLSNAPNTKDTEILLMLDGAQ